MNNENQYKKKIRFATIGTNFITEWFLEAAKKCSNLEYAAVYSRHEETAQQFAAKHGAKRYETDLHLLAQADDIDAVYVASPNSLHCEQSILMMEHGKHVLCEKPIASNTAELKRMLDSAEKNQVVLLEAIRNVFDPGFEAVKDNLPKLGKIRRASFQYCQYSSRYDKFKAGIIENAFKTELSNGALMDIGVYCVHALVKLFGKPDTIHAEGVILKDSIDGSGTILAGYPEMQAELIYSKISNSKIPSQIQGEAATMVIREISDIQEIEIYYNNGKTEKIIIKKEPSMYYETKEWAAFIENGLTAKEYNRYSLIALALMDEARSQQNIVFPADQ